MRSRTTKASIVSLMAVATLLAGALVALAPTRATGDVLDTVDCTGEVGDPAEGTFRWDVAATNNLFCSTLGHHTKQSNPAYWAARAANIAAGSQDGGDPLRDAATRWAGKRGEWQQVTWTDRDGQEHYGELYAPFGSDAGPPLPGIMVLCHICRFRLPLGASPGVIPVDGDGYKWGAQVLAEHGYVVMFADISVGDITTAGDHWNSIPWTIDAADWFVSTPDNPGPQGEVNPWHARLDREHLGIVGHSGAGGLAVNVGNIDDRFSAIVSWDPAGPNLDELEAIRTPAMVQPADYSLNPEPRHSPPPPPEPGSKFTYYETIKDAGVDTMQVVARASTHGDHLNGGSWFGQETYGYYTLAWFDRYVRGATDAAVAADALRRLAAQPTDRFDDSYDVHAIGTGFFDPLKAAQGGSIEAGNVPFRIAGQRVGTRLSWWYPTRYFLDGGSLQCENVRLGCP